MPRSLRASVPTRGRKSAGAPREDLNVGQVVQGYLFIDTYNPLVTTGDEVVRLPYSYTTAP